MKKYPENGKFIYIAQNNQEKSWCKIGRTKNLQNRLNDYQGQSGQSTDKKWDYLYCCEVSDDVAVEKDIKHSLGEYRQNPKEEIFFYSKGLHEKYVAFIRNHKLLIREIEWKNPTKKEKLKIVKRPTLKASGDTRLIILNRAKNQDNDEFYTIREDVEKELNSYELSLWQDKVVLCNCDDAVGDTINNQSSFALYFIENFKRLKLKKLICTHYAGKVDLFNQGRTKGYVFTKDGVSELKDFPKNYDGSFDHPYSLKLLQECDIVCTNPPFSRAIDYWKLIINSKKKFIIISNVTNPITTAFIPYFQKKQVWAGYNSVDNFINSSRQLVRASGHWYTNVPIKNRPKHKNLKMEMTLKQIQADDRKRRNENKRECANRDDSGMLVVDKYIPSDYTGPIAVSCRPILNGILEKGYKIINNKQYIPTDKGKKCFARVLIQKVI